MKKRILIVNNNMKIGGVQKSLINLLREISSLCDVTLFLFDGGGALINDVPDNVKILRGSFFTRVLGISHDEAKDAGFLTFAFRSLCAALTKIFGIKPVFSLLSHLQKTDGEYDAAISFMQNGDLKVFYGGCNEFVLNAVKAKKKIAFVHCDFLNYEGNNEYNKKIYSRFDSIACVSDSVKKRFSEATVIPGEKLFTVHNCYDYKNIIKLAHEYKAEYTDGHFNIFTASRLSAEKGILRALKIIHELKEEGYGIIWRIAGDGPQKTEIELQIKSYGLEKNIKLLGMKKNPYPYFLNADLLLVPSYIEAAPMVYGEAEILGAIILTTDTTSAMELVSARGIGFVCRNDDVSIKEELKRIIDGGEVRNKNDAAFNNDIAVKEFLTLIGETYDGRRN